MDEGGWSRKVMEMGQGTDKDGKGKKGGHTMTRITKDFLKKGRDIRGEWLY